MIVSRTDSVKIEQDNFCPHVHPDCDCGPIPVASLVTPTRAVPIEGSPSLPQNPRLVPLANIAMEDSAENASVIGGAVPCAVKGLTSLDLLRWRRLRSFARWWRRLPGQLRVFIC
jgi:hypothetical protein